MTFGSQQEPEAEGLSGDLGYALAAERLNRNLGTCAGAENQVGPLAKSSTVRPGEVHSGRGVAASSGPGPGIGCL